MDTFKIDELKKQMRNVPFGNSCYQIAVFSRGSETPERLYRNTLLQLHQKLNALKQCELRRKRIEIDIEEIKEKMQSAEKFELRRLEVDLEEKEYYLENEVKLIEDCIIEIRMYMKILEGLPQFTREQFEKAEADYWEKRLLNDMRNEILSLGHVSKDTIESLQRIGIIVGRNERGEIAYTKIEKPEGGLDYDNILCLDKTD